MSSFLSMFSIEYKDGQYDRQKEQEAQETFAQELQEYLAKQKK